MTRYAQLIKELDETLEKRRAVSCQRSRYGMTPARGKETEWDRLDKEAEELRRQLRRSRYGTDE